MYNSTFLFTRHRVIKWLFKMRFAGDPSVVISTAWSKRSPEVAQSASPSSDNNVSSINEKAVEESFSLNVEGKTWGARYENGILQYINYQTKC